MSTVLFSDGACWAGSHFALKVSSARGSAGAQVEDGPRGLCGAFSVASLTPGERTAARSGARLAEERMAVFRTWALAHDRPARMFVALRR